jgi:hypothetical protein
MKNKDIFEENIHIKISTESKLSEFFTRRESQFKCAQQRTAIDTGKLTPFL